MKTIVMTGGTAGLGKLPADMMAGGDARLLLGARRAARSGEPGQRPRVRRGPLQQARRRPRRHPRPQCGPADSEHRPAHRGRLRDELRRGPPRPLPPLAALASQANPSFTSGKSLYRDAPFFLRMGVALGGFFGQASPVDVAGRALADLALGQVEPPEGRLYASLVRKKLTWPDPSVLALRDELAQSVWRDSARMVELPES